MGQAFSEVDIFPSIVYIGGYAIIAGIMMSLETDRILFVALFTKSVMDGAMAVLLTAAMGIGVVFSILTILIYQGGLTLLEPVVLSLM